jgi:type II secretory pathway component PulF
MFEDMGQILPLPTRALIALGEFFKKFWWLIAASFGLVVFGWVRRGGSPEGRIAIDNFKLKLPLFGELIKKREIAGFARTLAALLANGVPILSSLEIVTQTVKNAVLKQELKAIARDVAAGLSLSGGVGKSGHFPVFVVNMINVGEESGSLEKALFRVAEIYQRELDRVLKIFTSWLEPIMILIMGAIVGFIVIAMLLPIFQISIFTR